MILVANAAYSEYPRPTTVTGLSNGHLLQCCMQYIVTACRYDLDMRSSLFWYVTLRRLVDTDVSGLHQNVVNNQSTPRNIPEERRSYTAAEASNHTHWRSAVSLRETGSRQSGRNGNVWCFTQCQAQLSDVPFWTKSYISYREALKSNSGCNPCLRKSVREVWCDIILPEVAYLQSSCLDSCGVS